MDKRHNNKGVTLVEMLIVLAIVAMILPLIFQLFAFGQESFTYTNKLIAQQYTVTNVMQHIRGDVQGAASVYTPPIDSDPGLINVYPKVYTLRLGYYSNGSTTIDKYKYWRFYCDTAADEGKLQYSGDRTESDVSAIADSDYSDVVTGLDILNCKFERKISDPDRNKLTIWIKPIATNSGKAEARNVKKPIITEISVLYKF